MMRQVSSSLTVQTEYCSFHLRKLNRCLEIRLFSLEHTTEKEIPTLLQQCFSLTSFLSATFYLAPPVVQWHKQGIENGGLKTENKKEEMKGNRMAQGVQFSLRCIQLERKGKSSKEKEANSGLGWPRQMVRSKAYGPSIDVLLAQFVLSPKNGFPDFMLFHCMCWNKNTHGPPLLGSQQRSVHFDVHFNTCQLTRSTK